jgi:hypothetical protein
LLGSLRHQPASSLDDRLLVLTNRSSAFAIRTALTLAMMTLALLAVAMAPSSSGGAESGNSRAGDLRDLLLWDMNKASEAAPHGVPLSYDWATHPRERAASAPAQFSAFIAWGQLYRCAGAAFVRDDTVEFRDLQTWLLIDGRWSRVQRSSEMSGSSFPENYVGSPVRGRVLARSTAGTKVRMRRGYNFHFWPATGRVRFDPSKVSAIVVLVRARRSSAARRDQCAVLSVGGDYWRSIDAVQAGSTNAVDAGIGRFKRVRSSWRVFSMTTASAATLTRHPLPVGLPVGELQ